MKNEEIDKAFRERLHDTQEQPPAFVWPAVESEIRERKRRKALIFWLMGGGLAVFALGGWYFRNAQPAPLVHAQEALVIYPESNQINISTTSTSNPTQSQSKNSESIVASTTPISSGRKHNLEKPYQSIESVNAAFTPAPAPETTVMYSKGMVDVLGANTLSTIQDQAIIPDGNTTTAQWPTSLGSIRSDLTILPQRTTFLGLEKDQIQFPAIDLPIIKKRKINKACYDFSKVPFAWLLDAYVGPSLSRKSLRAAPDDRPYLNQRLNTESQDWSFNAGVRASLVFNRHFLLRTGLHYDQAVETFEFIDPNFVKYNIVVSVSNGMQKIDTISIEYGANYLKTYNRLGWLDVPLQLGIELRRGHGGISINSGVSLNILFWKRGAVLAPDGNAAYFTPGSGTYDLYQKRVGLSALGSIQWFYHLSPRLRVFAEPYYRQILRSVSLPSHPVTQEYGIGGVRLGLTKIL